MKICGTLTIFLPIFLILCLAASIASAANVESGIIELSVGKERNAAGQTFSVFTGGQDITIVATVGSSAYDKGTDKWDYLIEPHFDKHNFEFVSEEYKKGKYTIRLRTKDMTDKNTTVRIEMMTDNSNIPSQERVYFNISRAHSSKLKVLSPESSVPEGRVKIDFDAGISEEQEKSMGHRITGRLVGGNIPVNISLDNGESSNLIDGYYEYHWEERDNRGVIDSGVYSFVVMDTVQTGKARIKVAYPPTVYVGQEVSLDFLGTFVDDENATVSVYEGEKILKNLKPSRLRGNISVRFDSPGDRKLTVKVWRMNKDRMEILKSETFHVRVSGTAGNDGQAEAPYSASATTREELSWNHIQRLDFNVELPRGQINTPYTLNVLELVQSGIEPGAECYIVVNPDYPEARCLIYDPADESSLTTSYSFVNSGPKRIYIQIHNSRGILYGRCELYIQDPDILPAERISLGKRCLNWSRE